MKVKTLIKKLQALEEKYGNIPVETFTGEQIKSVRMVKFSKSFEKWDQGGKNYVGEVERVMKRIEIETEL